MLETARKQGSLYALGPSCQTFPGHLQHASVSVITINAQCLSLEINSAASKCKTNHVQLISICDSN